MVLSMLLLYAIIPCLASPYLSGFSTAITFTILLLFHWFLLLCIATSICITCQASTSFVRLHCCILDTGVTVIAHMTNIYIYIYFLLNPGLMTSKAAH